MAAGTVAGGRTQASCSLDLRLGCCGLTLGCCSLHCDKLALRFQQFTSDVPAWSKASKACSPRLAVFLDREVTPSYDSNNFVHGAEMDLL